MTEADTVCALARKDDTWQLRVLVVGNDRDGTETIVEMLRVSGYDAWAAGEGLVWTLRDGLPDVVLLDTDRPDTGRSELVRRLRNQAREKPPFVIAVTGPGKASVDRQTEEASADLHLAGPFQWAVLRKVLQRFSRVIMPTSEEVRSAALVPWAAEEGQPG